MKRVVWLLPVLLLLLPLTVFGDTEPPSFTLDVTNLFREDQDRYIDPVYWGELDGGVLFLQLDTPGGGTYFEAGIGLPLGGLYFGFNYYGGNYTEGNLTNESTIEQTSETAYTVDTNGQILTITDTETVEIGYRNVVDNDGEILVGLSLGDIDLGIKNRVTVDDTSYFGTYAPSFTMPANASFTAPDVDTGSYAATTVTTTEPGGTVPLSMISEEYALGENSQSYFQDVLTVGMNMPLGDLALRGSVGFNFYAGDQGQSAAYETYTTDSVTGYPAYTPTTALPGNTAAAIDNAESYRYMEALEDMSLIRMIPSLAAGISTPLAFDMPVTLEAGVGGQINLYNYTTAYDDLAGTEQTISGFASDYYEENYTANETSPGVFETTAATIRAYETQEYSYLSWQIQPDVRVLVEPEERFRFGIGYKPIFSGWKSSSSSAGGAQSVTTYEDGDGVNGNTDGDDPDDYVQTRTVTRNGESVTYTNFTLEHQVDVGAQFYLIPEKLRINLGSNFANEMIDKGSYTKTTTGTIEYTETTSTNGEAAVETDYDIDTAPPQQVDQDRIDGDLDVDYDAGLTFFFSENMYLDLRMWGGDIWNSGNWSLEMTIKF